MGGYPDVVDGENSEILMRRMQNRNSTIKKKLPTFPFVKRRLCSVFPYFLSHKKDKNFRKYHQVFTIKLTKLIINS